MVKLKAELRRTTEERDILKKPQLTLPGRPAEVRVYASTPTRVSPDQLCRLVRRSSYDAWLREPLSPRAKANEKLTSQIREFYDQSMGS